MQTDNAPSCSSGSPNPDLFEIRRSQTTKVQTANAHPDLFEIGRSQTTNEEMSFRFCYLRCKRLTPLSVVQDRQILNCLKGGALKLQRCKRLTLTLPVILTCLRSGALKLQMGITEFGTGKSLLLHRDREVPPTGVPRDREGSPTASVVAGRSALLLPAGLLLFFPSECDGNPGRSHELPIELVCICPLERACGQVKDVQVDSVIICIPRRS